VVETTVHYPTDINLLYDALRKSVELTASLCNDVGIPGWRQKDYQLRSAKRLMRICQKSKHSTSKDEEKKRQKQQQVEQAHRDYIFKAKELLARVKRSLETLRSSTLNPRTEDKINRISYFAEAGHHQLNLIVRRVLNGEIIPHSDKVFSLFEPHTEWISKGKAGVPQELGKRVCIMSDQFGFILSHTVMDRVTDSDIAVDFVRQCKDLYPELEQCSFDKGFWSPENERRLNKILSLAVLPRKGKLSAKRRQKESEENFALARKKHSAVESSINTLENHGLDRCPDKGEKHFHTYVSLAVAAGNIHRLGSLLMRRENEAAQHSRKIKLGLAGNGLKQAG